MGRKVQVKSLAFACIAFELFPEILLSGNHAAVAKWRREQSEQRTRERNNE